MFSSNKYFVKSIFPFFYKTDQKRHNVKTRNFNLDFIPSLATVISFPKPIVPCSAIYPLDSGYQMLLFVQNTSLSAHELFIHPLLNLLPIVNFAVMPKWWSFNILQYPNNINPVMEFVKSKGLFPYSSTLQQMNPFTLWNIIMS